MIGQWSRFYKFWEIYEYLGHFDESGESRRGKVLFDGSEGVPHSDGGFRLRSTMGGHLSFSNIPLKTSLETFPCPLERGDIGCYFVRVRVEDTVWDYIGKSAELKKGISDRLREHLIKIAGTTSIHHVTPTRKFSSLNAELRTDFHLNPNTSEFFDDHVELALSRLIARLRSTNSMCQRSRGWPWQSTARWSASFLDLIVPTRPEVSWALRTC